MMYVALAILALVIGSFLNLLIYRLPKMLEYNFKRECAVFLKKPIPKPLKINLFYPRSFCTVCKKTIPMISNIPLLSYCVQQGKCRSCKAHISFQYPLVEALTLILSLFAAWQFGFTTQLGFALLFIWMVLPLFFIDMKHYLLPDGLTLSLLWVGLIANTQGLFCDLPDAVYGAVVGYSVLFVVTKLFFLSTGKVGMGQGDLKLFAALGAWFGWFMLPLMLLIASVMGVLAGLFYLKSTGKSKDTPIPFGPFICLSGLLALYYGNTVLIWYLG